MSFPSIWEAELQHKGKKEDRTTSRLFGYLGRLPPELQSSFLRKIRFERMGSTAIKEVRLWYSVASEAGDEREIDAVLFFEDRTLIVEVKLDSPLDDSQLVDEFMFAKREYPNVALATVTAHDDRPELLGKVEKKLGTEIGWASWHDCLKAAIELKSVSTDPVTTQNLNDLIEYLHAVDVMMTPGFSEKDDWTSYVRLEYGFKKFKDAVIDEIKVRPFSTDESVQPDDWEGHHSALGFWIYAQGRHERGFWFSMGQIDGKNQVEFAPYEERGQDTLKYLVKRGFEVKHPGAPWGTDKNAKPLYVSYSKCLPFGSLKATTLEEQLAEILRFIRQCRAEVNW